MKTTNANRDRASHTAARRLAVRHGREPYWKAARLRDWIGGTAESETKDGQGKLFIIGGRTLDYFNRATFIAPEEKQGYYEAGTRKAQGYCRAFPALSPSYIEQCFLLGSAVHYYRLGLCRGAAFFLKEAAPRNEKIKNIPKG
jgi:hypothetical protein